MFLLFFIIFFCHPTRLGKCKWRGKKHSTKQKRKTFKVVKNIKARKNKREDKRLKKKMIKQTDDIRNYKFYSTLFRKKNVLLVNPSVNKYLQPE